MSKRIKALTTDELSRRYGELDSLCVVSVSGLDATASNRLRGELRENDVELHVIKNRLARRALGDGVLGPLVAGLAGPCAFAYGGESIIDVAKLLVKLGDAYPQLELKEGIIEGEPDLYPVTEIAKMQSRTETIAEVVSLALSPGRRIAGCLTGPGGRIAGGVKAVVERREQEGDAAAA